MQNAADHASVQPGDPSENYTAITSNLGFLVEQVSTMIKLIESAIASEASTDHADVAANIVVLDDVTPRYVRANAALRTSHAGLGVALHLVHDIRNSRLGPADRRFADALRPGRCWAG